MNHCEQCEKVVEFKPKKTFAEFQSMFEVERKDGGLTEQDIEELYKAYVRTDEEEIKNE